MPFTDFAIDDRFWTPRMETNRKATAWHCLRQLEVAGNVDNFRLAATGAKSGYHGPVYMDSDLYKVLEGIANILASTPDPGLETAMDEVVALVSAAQMPDGYLNTWHQVNKPNGRWSNLRDAHELYCAGHLIEAGVAHHRATGRTDLLNVALRFAEHIERWFGEGGNLGYPGHPEIELALVKLADHTGDLRWRDLAQQFVDRRGTGYFAKEHGTSLSEYDGDYWIDEPVGGLRSIKGHAVRACYLMSGITDLAMDSDDADLKVMLQKVWANATEKKRYITGGIGSSKSNEGFTEDYDLPNDTAYQETCATISLAQWGARMSRLFQRLDYFDVVETALYNAMLSGVGLDGSSFFYSNPLETKTGLVRQPWFPCACCPPNILRTLASIGGYVFSASTDTLYVNLFVAGSLKTQIGGQEINLRVKTDYPWDGKVAIFFDSPCSLDVVTRTPNTGQTLHRGPWESGSQIILDLPMPIEVVAPDPNVAANRGKLAVRRGPIVYCLEGEAAGKHILRPESVLETVPGEGALRGMTLIRQLPEGALFIPYGAWANRGPQPMKVWL